MATMKKFLIIGNMNATTYKEVFPLIKDNKLWLGAQYVKEFVSDSGEIKKFGNVLWYTNLEHNKRHSPITLTQAYSSDRYPKYDNYDAIEVSRTKDIPKDYDGVMGVPITFLDKYCLEQFEIVGMSRHNNLNMDGGYWLGVKADATINGKEVYRRILIRFKK